MAIAVSHAGDSAIAATNRVVTIVIVMLAPTMLRKLHRSLRWPWLGLWPLLGGLREHPNLLLLGDLAPIIEPGASLEAASFDALKFSGSAGNDRALTRDKGRAEPAFAQIPCAVIGTTHLALPSRVQSAAVLVSGDEGFDERSAYSCRIATRVMRPARREREEDGRGPAYRALAYASLLAFFQRLTVSFEVKGEKLAARAPGCSIAHRRYSTFPTI